MRRILFLFIILLSLSACNNTIDKDINEKDFTEKEIPLEIKNTNLDTYTTINVYELNEEATQSVEYNQLAIDTVQIQIELQTIIDSLDDQAFGSGPLYGTNPKYVIEFISDEDIFTISLYENYRTDVLDKISIATDKDIELDHIMLYSLFSNELNNIYNLLEKED